MDPLKDAYISQYKLLNPTILRKLFWGFVPTTETEYKTIIHIVRIFTGFKKVLTSTSDEHKKILNKLATYGEMLNTPKNTYEKQEILVIMKSCVNQLAIFEEKLKE